MSYIKEDLKCPYCNAVAILRDSKVIYNGRSFGLVYICKNYPRCDAYVGAHIKTLEPKGSLADAKLREFRKKCHLKFDKLWKELKMSRVEAYKYLAKKMNLKVEKCHIAMFDMSQCEKLLRVLN